MAREIKIFGSGCSRCEALYDHVVLALDELGIEATVEKVRDLKQMASYGVINPPALAVDGRLVSQGKVLSVEEIKHILAKDA